ncbi:MAG: glucose-1-phosphate adenylyltransferase [Proteobacteria bacterium]|nr:glucose-1-phosphate adenylyltransferase [Pseudomonadota bacterium]
MRLQHENIQTFILAGGKGSRLYPLTRHRSKPAVFFAARYRIIDFVLSSCINSGIRQIYVLTQTKSFSLEQHLRRSWNYLPAQLGEFVAAVPAQQRISEQWYRGTADAIFQNMNLIEDHRPEHVLILSGDHIYSMDFGELFRQHVESESDLTISVIPIKKKEASPFGVLSMDPDSRITSFLEKPQDPSLIPGEGDDCYINMGIYLFRTEPLVRMLAKDARENSSHDFGKDIIPAMLNSYRVSGFHFPKSRFGHYWRDVGTIQSYFEANMEFLDHLSTGLICTPEWPIGSLGVRLAPTYLGGDSAVTIEDSTVDIGSTLRSCHLKRSLIGRKVTIDEGSVIENSIIMSRSRIGKGCVIRNAIFDDGARVPDNTTIGVNPEEDMSRFFISDGIVVLPKGFQL